MTTLKLAKPAASELCLLHEVLALKGEPSRVERGFATFGRESA